MFILFYFIFFQYKTFLPWETTQHFLHRENKQLMRFYEGITTAKLQINNEILCWNVL